VGPLPVPGSNRGLWVDQIALLNLINGWELA
jgi:hypothetical protein